jgi:hypothetical protein
MKEKLLGKQELCRIEAPYFTAGLLLENDIVKDAAPIIKYLVGKNRLYVVGHAFKKEWRLSWRTIYENNDSV